MAAATSAHAYCEAIRVADMGSENGDALAGKNLETYGSTSSEEARTQGLIHLKEIRSMIAGLDMRALTTHELIY